MTMDLDKLKCVARQLVMRVRDEDPAAVGRWLQHTLPEPDDWFRLVFVLACAVPDDRTWSELLAWTGEPQTTLEQRRRQWRDSKARHRSTSEPRQEEAA